MAMYENLGFCPNNQFLHYALEEKNIPDVWNRTREILGDRTGNMVYTKAGTSCRDKWCHVVDCLVGAESTIGVEISNLLKTMIPQCKYAEIGKKILVTDVINPFQIPHINRVYGDGDKEKYVATNDVMNVFEDERYVCGVTDEGESIHLYFFKK